jgi:hypothetical protein
MPAALPSNAGCSAAECADTVTVQVPGPTGATGSAGSDGTDGLDSFTTTSAQFTQPASGSNVAITVAESGWMSVGQVIFIQSAGYFTVVSKASSTAVTIQNLGYTGNAAATTVIASGSQVSPGGLRGAAGVDGDGAIPLTTKADILTHDGTEAVRLAAPAYDGMRMVKDDAEDTGWRFDYVDLSKSFEAEGPGGEGQVIHELSIANGGTGGITALQGFKNLSPTTTRGDMIYMDGTTFNARLAVGAVNTVLYSNGTDPGYSKVTQAMIDAGGPMSRYGLLGSLVGADFNSTADQAITILSGVTKYIIRRIIATNASVNLTTAVGGLYGAAAKSAPNIVANTQVYSALTASSKFVDLTLTALCGTDIFTQATLYLSLTTAQGSAAMGDIYIFGENVT